MTIFHHLDTIQKLALGIQMHHNLVLLYHLFSPQFVLVLKGNKKSIFIL